MDIKTYVMSLAPDERRQFADRCGTSLGHLRNIGYGFRTCADGLAIAIERESGGAVTVEELSPDTDWAYIRNSKRPMVRKRAAAGHSSASDSRG